MTKHNKLDIICLNSKAPNQIKKLAITPNSINNRQYNLKLGHIFSQMDMENAHDNELASNLKQFEVTYNENCNEYRIKDYFNGTGLFVAVNDRFLINSEYIISFLNSHFLCYHIRETNQIKIRFIQGFYENMEFAFDPRIKPIIIIGRCPESDIVLDNDESISRVQCTLFFDHEHNNWYICDGYPGKPSTNGLWYLARKEIPIFNGMMIKNGHSTFIAKLHQ